MMATIVKQFYAQATAESGAAVPVECLVGRTGTNCFFDIRSSFCPVERID